MGALAPPPPPPMGGGGRRRGPPGPPGGKPAFSAAATISSSRTANAAHKTIHSTPSSLPSPILFQTAFSSSVRPVMATRVPPPASAGFLLILPNSTRLGGMR